MQARSHTCDAFRRQSASRCSCGGSGRRPGLCSVPRFCTCPRSRTTSQTLTQSTPSSLGSLDRPMTRFQTEHSAEDQPNTSNQSNCSNKAEESSAQHKQQRVPAAALRPRSVGCCWRRRSAPRRHCQPSCYTQWMLAPDFVAFDERLRHVDSTDMATCRTVSPWFYAGEARVSRRTKRHGPQCL